MSVPKLYSTLAEWWPLLSPPEEYVEEATAYAGYLLNEGSLPARTLLELGSGGGSNAFHLKRHFEITLTDLSADMLAVSRSINPECEHIQGDMRTLRLGREFDRIFVHDAVSYMTSIEDLRLAVETAFVHCRPGGLAVFAPDYVRETWRPSTDHGGHDGEGRSLRYLEWVWDPDPSDQTYLADYVYVLRESDGTVHTEHDRHVEGCFSRAQWLQLLEQMGFEARFTSFEHSEVEYPLELLLATKPAS